MEFESVQFKLKYAYFGIILLRVHSVFQSICITNQLRRLLKLRLNDVRKLSERF